jgi:hypothetical protein
MAEGLNKKGCKPDDPAPRDHDEGSSTSASSAHERREGEPPSIADRRKLEGTSRSARKNKSSSQGQRRSINGKPEEEPCKMSTINKAAVATPCDENGGGGTL